VVAMSQSTFGVRCSKENKTEWDNILKEIPLKFGNTDMNKEDALSIVFKTYADQFIGEETIEMQIKQVIDFINCKYLNYVSNTIGFVCNEYFHRKKKGDAIGFIPANIIRRCTDCKQGKEDEKERYYEKMLEKDSIRKILDLRKMFLQLSARGLEVEVYSCKHDFLTLGTMHYSLEGIYLPCSLEKGEAKSIEKKCMNMINEKTSMPPCQHLIILNPRAKIKDFDTILNEFEKSMPQIEEAPQTKKIEVEIKEDV
jgi:hypothetical protein